MQHLVRGNSMKAYLLRLALATAAMIPVTSALAADLEPPPPVDDLRPATYDWSGIYAGGFGGLIFLETPYVPVGSGDPEFGGSSGVAGVFAGAQWQWDSLVLGVEGDWGWGLGETAENILDETDYTINHIATLRARLGFASDNTLLYLTGGAAMANGTLDAYVLGIDDDATHWGWTIGGGMEHAFSENFTARLEYLYAHFGKETYDLSPAGTVDMGLDDVHMIRAGIAYKFSL